jgi:hypothetical protein
MSNEPRAIVSVSAEKSSGSGFAFSHCATHGSRTPSSVNAPPPTRPALDLVTIDPGAADDMWSELAPRVTQRAWERSPPGGPPARCLSIYPAAPVELLVYRPEHVTTQWLNDALSGVIGENRIESFDVEEVGTGQMADCFRFDLHYAEGRSAPGAPATVVGKFTAAHEQSRTTGVSMRTAEVEVRFYQRFGESLPIRTPACLHAEVDPDTARFVLLLEDLAPARQGDQVTGCSVDEAASALEEMAKLHAPCWGDRSLESVEWLNRRNEQQVALLESIYPAFFAGFVERYGAGIPRPILVVGEPFFQRVGVYLRARADVNAVQHADFRVDNLLFGGPDGRVAVVDWQTVTLGPPVADLSYFLGGSITVEDRRAHEKDLVDHYHEHLVAAGVHGYRADELWTDYRRYAYSGLVMAVGAAIMVERTERGDSMFLVMAERAAVHALDMESSSLLT